MLSCSSVRFFRVCNTCGLYEGTVDAVEEAERLCSDSVAMPMCDNSEPLYNQLNLIICFFLPWRSSNCSTTMKWLGSDAGPCCRVPRQVHKSPSNLPWWPQLFVLNHVYNLCSSMHSTSYHIDSRNARMLELFRFVTHNFAFWHQ